MLGTIDYATDPCMDSTFGFRRSFRFFNAQDKLTSQRSTSTFDLVHSLAVGILDINPLGHVLFISEDGYGHGAFSMKRLSIPTRLSMCYCARLQYVHEIRVQPRPWVPR